MASFSISARASSRACPARRAWAPRWGATPLRPRSRRTGWRSRPPSERPGGRSRSARSGRRRPPRPTCSASPVSSQSSPSAMSRWQWLSTTGAGSGSGAGGALPAHAADRRIRVAAGAIRTAHDSSSRPSRANSSVTTESSSLVKIGLGFRHSGPTTDGMPLPRRRLGVVAGDHRIARAAVEVVDLLDARHRCDLAGCPPARDRPGWR